MKRMILTFNDNFEPDLTGLLPLIAVARSFSVETVADEHHHNRKPTHPHRGPKTMKQIIMGHYNGGGVSFSEQAAQKWLTENGYSPSSSSPTLSELVKNGYLRRVSLGKYEFVKPLE